MRKAMRYMLLVVVAMLMVGLFIGSSCDKSTNGGKDTSLVGTWKMLTMTMSLSNGAQITYTPAVMGYTSIRISLDEDGSATATLAHTDGSLETYEGIYDVDGDEITLSGTDIFEGTYDYDISGDKLTITVTETDDNGTPGDPSDDTSMTLTVVFEKI
ncbi:lipocalin family protein [bacterium]|nr:lipocalin family protein [bacterium]